MFNSIKLRNSIEFNQIMILNAIKSIYEIKCNEILKNTIKKWYLIQFNQGIQSNFDV